MITKLPFVPDWSHYVKIPDMSAVNPKPRMAITKATEGNYGRDSNFLPFWKAFKENGIPRGAYHYFIHMISAQVQAGYFTEFIAQGGVNPDDLLVIDVEDGGIQANEIIVFLNNVEAVYPHNQIIIYSSKVILDTITRTLTQVRLLNKYPLWIAAYPKFPDLHDWLPVFDTPTNWGPVVGWQYSDKGQIAGVSGDTDMNIFTADFLALFPQKQPESPTDTITTPHDGILRITGTRNGCRFVLDEIIPSKLRFDTVVLEPDMLAQVSHIAAGNGAIKGSNCGEWNDRYPDRDYYLQPINYTVSNGKVVISHTLAGQPSLLITNDNQFIIDDQPRANIKHAFTGLRFLVRSGVINPLLDGTEGHSRKVFGLKASGNLLELSVEGFYPNQGWTLPDCAQFMQEHGATIAADFGGGGDATCWADGELLLTPENPNGLERYLPNVFLVFGMEQNMNGTAHENLNKIPTIRNSPTVATGNDIYKGTAGMVVQFTETVSDTNPASTLKWLHLVDGNYVNLSDSTHSGSGAYFIITQQPTIDPIPPPTSGDIHLDATLHTNGTITGLWTNV